MDESPSWINDSQFFFLPLHTHNTLLDNTTSLPAVNQGEDGEKGKPDTPAWRSTSESLRLCPGPLVMLIPALGHLSMPRPLPCTK